MDWKVFENKATEIVVTILVFSISALVAFFRKLPKRYKHNYRRKRQMEGLRKGSTINNIIRKLTLESNAIYIHVIRYHNGGPYKMSVEWEGTGLTCAGCTHSCRNFKGVRPVQKDWQNEKVTDIWGEIVYNTIRLDGGLNIVTSNTFDQMHMDIRRGAFRLRN